MYWYGWIPILTPCVLFEFALKGAKKDESRISRFEDSDERDLYVVNRDFPGSKIKDREFPIAYRTAVRKQLDCQAGEQVLYSVGNFDDGRRSGPKRFAFRVDKNDLVVKTVIGPVRAVSESIRLFESRGHIEEIQPSGLVRYTVEVFNYPPPEDYTQEQWQAIVGRYHFGIVRDVYHEHVYHPQGDFLLRPVYAENEKAALSLICEQYGEMVINSHKLMKGFIRHSIRWPWVGYTRYIRPVQAGIHARGNMVYCKQFHKIFGKCGHEDCVENDQGFAGAERSLALQQEELESILKSKVISLGQKAIYWLTLIALLLSSQVVLNALPETKTLSGLVRAVVGVGTVVGGWAVFWLWLLLPSISVNFSRRS